MTKPKASKRLSKLPEGRSDYVVETINESSSGRVTALSWFEQRADAREFAKGALNAGNRVRVFRATYRLVSDSKRKARKGAK
jgi:hypothetical protein